MKKIIFGLISTGLLAFSTTSCEDFLEESPKSNMSTEQNFASPAHAENAVNGLYRKGVPMFYADGGVYMPQRATHGGFLSGFFDNEYKGQEVLCDYSQKLSITSGNISTFLDGVWDEAYGAVSRANTAIKYIPETPELSEGDKNRLLGEAKFFRAFNYFYLVRYFGDVPLILEPYESLSDMYIARSATSEVYAQIVKDLTEAISALPSEAFCDNSHRIGRYTAQTVLAHVYLQMSGYPLQANNYAGAASAAREVINSGKHSLIPNGETPETSAYNVLRTVDDHPEYIYNIEFVTGISTNNARLQTSLPNIASTWSVYKYSITNNAYRPVREYMNVYDKTKDLRAQQGQYFFYTITYEKNGEVITYEIPEDKSPSPHLWYEADAALNTGNCDKDFTIYRYAEVLLIAAEAIAQSEGVTAEAVRYLTDVRARAYTSTPRAEIESSLQALDREAFVREVWLERMRELVFEFRTWDDIQRTRLYPVTSEAAPGKATFVNVVGAINPWGQVFKETHLLWPISANELQRNPALTPNPGYN
ncbi:MAG: RagB/SusD family nutrient uptake outer membrane protein [Tannerellaceae bacterium]|nr:RagB/SusD family nutrient uptake outer membrane protein [Tannerellaceae bacterium]